MIKNELIFLDFILHLRIYGGVKSENLIEEVL